MLQPPTHSTAHATADASAEVAAVSAAALAVLAATDVRTLASALLAGLADCGLPARAMAWLDAGQLRWQPPWLADADAPAIQSIIESALLGGADRLPAQLHLLHADIQGPQAVLLLPDAEAGADTAAPRTPAQQQLLQRASQRLVELQVLSQLLASVQQLKQAEQLQHALFTIADLAASVHDMDDMLRGLHRIIGSLMYAHNFFIALHDRERQSLRFLYFVDEKDGPLYAANDEIPEARMADSFTLAIIRQARRVRGPAEQVATLLGLDQGAIVGTPSVDFMGVPMMREGQALGVLAVQSYCPGFSYTEADCALLGFVAEHVLNAIERKHSQQRLEQHVAERTRELARANAMLQQQVAERERAAHLQATLYRIAALANTQESHDSFYRSVHLAVGELINAENFYIALISADGAELQFPYRVDTSGETGQPRPLGRGVSEYLMRHGRTLLLTHADLQQLLAQGDIELPGPRQHISAVCWLGAPLLGSQGVIGVVAVQSYRPDLRYSPQDADLLTFVSHQIANSVQRRQQAQALQAFNAELEQRVQQRTSELRQEIAVREQIQAQLKHQVMHDPLTGLPNRVYLRDCLRRALQAYQGHADQGFALLYLDVDRFKLINDSLGHLTGDQVLVEVARRLLDSLRPQDMVARLSGDEFAILVHDPLQPDTACLVARRIQQRMQTPVPLAERELPISVSIGIAVCHARYRDIDAILHDADLALYRAKAGGRQRYMLFEPEPQGVALNVLEIEQQLRQALRVGQLQPYYQPIVRLADLSVVGWEVLMRWHHPRRGLLAPGDFLPVAEQTGLVEALDWHLYRLACQEGAALLHSGAFMTLNVSARHFLNVDFAQMLLALLQETGLPAARLHIEITESALLRDPHTVAPVLQQLRDAGVGVALDDFGTGYSSLGHVHRFALSMIKIDRSFTGDLGASQQPRGVAIIEAILSLGRSLALHVVAEGVENQAQRHILRDMGCQLGQGYFFGRPAPAEHWLALQPTAQPSL